MLPAHAGNALVRVSCKDDLERTELLNGFGEEACGLVASAVNLSLSLTSKPNKVVILSNNLAAGTSEIVSKNGHVAAQVIHVEDKLPGKIGKLPPDDPFDS